MAGPTGREERIYEVSITDPVRRTLVEANIYG
jgi:hypothetical protein